MTHDDFGRPPMEILVVEDNPGDALLTREALKTVHPANRVSIAHDGEEAIAFLRGEGAHAGAPRPDLILLDLGLPKMDGLQVLKEIKRDPLLRPIPVLIMTSTTKASDLCRAGETSAQGLVVKSMDMKRFASTVRAAAAVWSRAKRELPDS